MNEAASDNSHAISVSTSWAPASSSVSAHARPIPPAAPVTITTRPWSGLDIGYRSSFDADTNVDIAHPAPPAYRKFSVSMPFDRTISYDYWKRPADSIQPRPAAAPRLHEKP